MKKFTAQEFKDWFDPQKHIGLKVKVKIKVKNFACEGIIAGKNFRGKTTKNLLIIEDCQSKNKFFSFDDFFLAKSKAVIRIIPEAVATPTQADFDRLMKAYAKRGIRWRAGNVANDCQGYWKDHKDRTHVLFLADFDGAKPSGIWFGKKDSFEGCSVLTLAEALERMGEQDEEEKAPRSPLLSGLCLKPVDFSSLLSGNWNRLGSRPSPTPLTAEQEARIREITREELAQSPARQVEQAIARAEDQRAPEPAQPPKRAFWEPVEHEHYLVIKEEGEIGPRFNVNTETGKSHYLTGNVFRADDRSKAEALISLRKHIVEMDRKYGKPEPGSSFYVLDANDKWQISVKYGKQLRTGMGIAADAVYYRLSGTVMHLDSTEEERAERLKLLRAYLGD